MVGCELNLSLMLPLFILFTGIKIKDTHCSGQISWWKYKDWSSQPGNTAIVTFQAKHQFDKDATIECLEYAMKQYSNRKIRIIQNACWAHEILEVEEFIEDNKEKLVKAGINSRLILVLQVADLAANKDLKSLIKDKYYVQRTKYIRQKNQIQQHQANHQTMQE